METPTFFRMEKINKFYQMGGEQAHILKDINLSIERGNTFRCWGPPAAARAH